jgi:hypothetical protein
VIDTLSKKQIILDFCRSQSFERIGREEFRAIEDELHRWLGPSYRPSLSYIAAVLRAAGKRVEYEDRFVDPATGGMEEPYAGHLKGVLQFHDLESAEASLRKLDTIYREYQNVSDRIGTSLVRSLVLKGKLRAESLAANPRVKGEKRREKQEIAQWFRVWLETPDLLSDWLALRKASDEFQHTFSGPSAGSRFDPAGAGLTVPERSPAPYGAGRSRGEGGEQSPAPVSRSVGRRTGQSRTAGTEGRR